MGPERTVYYAICYNSEGQVEYGEIIREIDDFVLSRVYLDGTSEDFEPPQLTIQQIREFAEKYPKYEYDICDWPLSYIL